MVDMSNLIIPQNLKVREEILEYFRSVIPQLNPNWTNVSDDDIGMVIVQIIASLSDTNNFRIDMSNLEHFLPTVHERSNAQGLLNLIGYQLSTYKTNWVDIVVKRKPDRDTGIIDNSFKIDIPAYSQFITENGDITYCNLYSTSIAKGIDEITLRVYEGIYASEKFDSVDIDSSGRFFLNDKLIPENAITVTYNNEPLTYSDDIFLAEDTKLFQLMTDKYSNNYVQLDATWRDYVNTLSAEPVVIEYLQTSLGAGLIGPNSLVALSTLGPTTPNPYELEIVNELASRGWSNPESIEQARIDAPKYARTMKSAVTLQDYEDLIELNNDYYDFFDAKVLDLNTPEANLTEAYQLKILVVNEDRTPLTEDNKTVLKRIIDNHRLATIKYEILDPENISINISIKLHIHNTIIDHKIIIDDCKALISNYFWNFTIGESFYISRLISYIHDNLKYDCLSYISFEGTESKKIINKVQRLILGTNDVTIEVLEQ